MKTFMVTVAFFSFGTLATKAEYVLNCYGTNGAYQICQVDDSGDPTDATVIISPSGSVSDIYWPTALRVGSDVYYYASERSGSSQSLALWIKSNGVLKRYGTVLAAQGNEVEIGMVHVNYDPDDAAAPFKFWYGAGASGVAARVDYAISVDGKKLTRIGTALTHSESGAAGVAPDYVCKDADGTWVLFYSAGAAGWDKFTADKATSSSPGGPFTRVGTILRYNMVSKSVSGTIVAGTRILDLTDPSDILPGTVWVLSNNMQRSTQRIRIKKSLTNSIVLDDPVYVEGTGYSLRPVNYRKVGLSYFWRDSLGVGHGVATGWGSFPGKAEYSFPVIEKDGVFVPDTNASDLFRPPIAAALWSYENPVPIRGGGGGGCILP